MKSLATWPMFSGGRSGRFSGAIKSYFNGVTNHDKKCGVSAGSDNQSAVGS